MVKFEYREYNIIEYDEYILLDRPKVLYYIQMHSLFQDCNVNLSPPTYPNLTLTYLTLPSTYPAHTQHIPSTYPAHTQHILSTYPAHTKRRYISDIPCSHCTSCVRAIDLRTITK